MTPDSLTHSSMRLIVIASLWACLLFLFSVPANAQRVERGKFVFYDTKQIAGEESYEITREGHALIIKSSFALPSLEIEKPLTATLRVRQDLTPERFEISGIKPSKSEIDTTIEINGPIARAREGKQTREISLPNRFFTIAGYAPLAIEMMLVRYCVTNGIKGALTILPAGQVTIEHRGRERVAVGAKQVQLDRYGLSGLTWGEQTLWLDSAGQLIAAVNIGYDTENTLPAVYEGYESALSFFLTRAAGDGTARLTKLADRLSRKRAGALAIVGGVLIDGTGKLSL